MKKIVFRIICIVLVFASSGCGVSQYASIQRKTSLDGYKYFYTIHTSQLSSGSGFVSGGQYGAFGGSSSKSVNPSDVISGYMMKQGFIRLEALDEQMLNEALIIAYGESGRHKRVLGLGYAIEVTLQFLDASSNTIVLTSTAAGMGETEADDIRKATLNCLDNIFKRQ